MVFMNLLGLTETEMVYHAWKVSVFGAILVRMRENTEQNNSEYGHF